MLDNEPENPTDPSAETGPAPVSTTPPPRRRRAASRPAGPPAPAQPVESALPVEATPEQPIPPVEATPEQPTPPEAVDAEGVDTEELVKPVEKTARKSTKKVAASEEQENHPSRSRRKAARTGRR